LRQAGIKECGIKLPFSPLLKVAGGIKEQSMGKERELPRRHFFKTGAFAAAAGMALVTGIAEEALAKSGAYATLIDLTKCDGCKNEPIPRCVEACRKENENKFPNPKGPIKDLWPQKTHDDWSKKKEVINALTPYNWTTIQKVEVEGEDIFVPRLNIFPSRD